MSVRWHHKAEIDLRHLSNYILQHNPKAGFRVFHKVVTTAEQLTRFPTLGRYGRVKGTRELVVSGLPYIIVYLRIADEIVIIAVQHTSRMWPEDFSEE